ncbi:MAG: hypothetical protein HUK15_08075 [Bacteroidales bacterium]|nr:hypothetical protein [Bacteroidales bacterium]
MIDGIAISFIGEKEISNFNRIEKLLERSIEKSPLPPSFGSAPEYKVFSKKSRHRKPRGKSQNGGSDGNTGGVAKKRRHFHKKNNKPKDNAI